MQQGQCSDDLCLFFCVYPSSMLPMWDVLKNSQAWGLENSSRCEAIFALEYNDILRLNFTRGFWYVKIFCCQIKDCNFSIISTLFKTIETKKIYNEKLRFWNIFDSQHFKELFFTEINLNFRIYIKITILVTHQDQFKEEEKKLHT